MVFGLSEGTSVAPCHVQPLLEPSESLPPVYVLTGRNLENDLPFEFVNLDPTQGLASLKELPKT